MEVREEKLVSVGRRVGRDKRKKGWQRRGKKPMSMWSERGKERAKEKEVQ